MSGLQYYVMADADNIVRSVIASNAVQSGAIAVTQNIYNQVFSRVGMCKLVANVVSDLDAASTSVPTSASLSDWRIGLFLWKRTGADSKITTRLDDVSNAIQALVSAGNPLGGIAQQRFQYANTVLRSELIQLKDAFGFSDSDVDESLWRADRVRQGDMTGTWPLTGSAP